MLSYFNSIQNYMEKFKTFRKKTEMYSRKKSVYEKGYFWSFWLGRKVRFSQILALLFFFCGFYENFDLSFAFIFYVFQPPVKTQKQAIHAQHSKPKINNAYRLSRNTTKKSFLFKKVNQKAYTKKPQRKTIQLSYNRTTESSTSPSPAAKRPSKERERERERRKDARKNLFQVLK